MLGGQFLSFLWHRPWLHSLLFGPQSPRCLPSQDPYPPSLRVGRGAGAQKAGWLVVRTCLHASSPPEPVVETTRRDEINTFPESESALQVGNCLIFQQER